MTFREQAARQIALDLLKGHRLPREITILAARVAASTNPPSLEDILALEAVDPQEHPEFTSDNHILALASLLHDDERTGT